MLAALLPHWSVSLVDASGTTGTTKGTFAGAGTAAEYLGLLATLTPLIAAISGCVPVRYSVTFPFRESPPSPLRSALFIPDLATLTFGTLPDVTPFTALVIPRKADILLHTGPLADYGVDFSLSIVTDFTDAIASGNWRDPFGLTIGPVLSGFATEHV